MKAFEASLWPPELVRKTNGTLVSWRRRSVDDALGSAVEPRRMTPSMSKTKPSGGPASGVGVVIEKLLDTKLWVIDLETLVFFRNYPRLQLIMEFSRN